MPSIFWFLLIDAKRLARPYLGEMIGGHGIINVETVIYSRNGFDGVSILLLHMHPELAKGSD